MLFNSFEYILIFLPVVLVCYFVLNKQKLLILSKCWLIFASIFFYGFLTPKYIPILLGSIFINFAIGSTLYSNTKLNKKILLFVGISINVLCLCYFKYMDFFITNVNYILKTHIDLLHITLPLGISFYTFQQIAYLVDSYQGKTKEYDFLSYTIFVSFFPQLVAGPIVHHQEIIPQFNSLKNKFLNYKNVLSGLGLFAIGLFKKVIIADTLAKYASLGFDVHTHLSILEAWIIIFSYTFQIYYDFSGYSDMAIGVGKMFNIELPQNFNNPYIAKDIQEFWRRWHITLSRFLKDYVYIPLGGNRKGNIRTYANLFSVFLICGFWHGASWMFVLWGIIHGLAIIINRIWQKFNIVMPKYLSWAITFLFISLSWVIFRAPNIHIAKNIYKSALGGYGFAIPHIYGEIIKYKPAISNISDNWETLSLFICPFLVIIIFCNYLHNKFKIIKPNAYYALAIATILFLSLICIIQPKYQSPFIYFNF